MRSVVGLALVLALGATVAHATDANLDPSFGTYGVTAANPSTGFDSGNDVAVQPDGRIVIAGSGFQVRRFTTSGGPDATFGVGGAVQTPLGSDAQAYGVALQPDGDIVVVGVGDVAPGDPATVAVRYQSDGTLDSSFGSGGITTVNSIAAATNGEAATGVAIQSDGKIVLAGYRFDGDNSTGFRERVQVVRLDANGTPDPAFATSGVYTLPLIGASTANDVAIQADGRIVVGGYAWVPYFSGFIQAFLVVRLNADGSADTSFDGDGIRIDGPGPEGSRLGYAVAIQPDGKILLGGHAGSHPAVLRYLTDGTPDATFGVGGIAETSFGNDFASMTDMILRPDGKIVLAGSVTRGSGVTDDTALVRFDAAGAVDSSFGNAGGARIVIGPRQSAAQAAALQADGKVVVTGWQADSANIGSDSDTSLYVARFGGSCGNAFLDPDEQCDDGNTDGLDCCSAGCGFVAAGGICDTADTSICTWDTCDGAGTCQVGGPWPSSECLAVTQPSASVLSINDDPTNVKDRLDWKWTRGAEAFFFGDPGSVTNYSMCVFGGSTLAAEHHIPPGAGWASTSRGWKLKRDPTTPGGISRVTLRAGAPGKSKIIVRGKGLQLGAAAVPLGTPVTAQLVNDAGMCFGASYPTPVLNANGKFRATGQ